MPSWLRLLGLAGAGKRGSANWNRYLAGYLDDLGIDPNDADAFRRAEATARRSYAASIADPSENLPGRRGASYGPGTTGTGLLGFGEEIVRSQLKARTLDVGEFGSLEGGIEAMQGIINAIKHLSVREAVTSLGSLMKREILVYLKNQADLFQSVNEKMAMTGELAEAFRDELMLASPDAIRLGISLAEMSDSVGELVAQSGKFKLLSSDTIKEMALASKFTEDMKTFAGMGRNYELIGLGIRDMSLLVEKMGIRSMSLGLNARTTTSMVNENLKNLNTYGFKNGVEGLNRMVQRSIEFRQNMQNVFDVAEKVWSPEGALEIVSNLQMIGGAYADMNDPIKLMYMATNDVEGLQKAILETAKSLVTFNEEQGRFQVMGANLRRAKEMAGLFGISMKELTDTAVAGAERVQASLDLMSAGLVMPEEDKEFLTNLSRMEGGRMVIEVPQTLRKQLGMDQEQTILALEDMKDFQKEALLANKKVFEKMTMEEIARQQVTAVENIERDVSFLRAVARVTVGQDIASLLENALGITQTVVSGESYKVADKLASGLRSGHDALLAEARRQFPQLQGIRAGQQEVVNEIKETRTSEASKQQKVDITTNAKAESIKTKEETGKITPNTATTPIVERKIIDVNFNPLSASLDSVARIFWGDPRWQEKFKDGFLYPFSN